MITKNIDKDYKLIYGCIAPVILAKEAARYVEGSTYWKLGQDKSIPISNNDISQILRFRPTWVIESYTPCLTSRIGVISLSFTACFPSSNL